MYQAFSFSLSKKTKMPDRRLGNRGQKMALGLGLGKKIGWKVGYISTAPLPTPFRSLLHVPVSFKHLSSLHFESKDTCDWLRVNKHDAVKKIMAAVFSK